jgi:hypothetical protein
MVYNKYMDRYYIYMITNTTNGKIYVGKRKCPKDKLPQTDSYMGSGVVLRHAFSKYGKDKFVKDVLIDGLKNNDEANGAEKSEINRLKSYDRFIGYNRTKGGDGGYLTEFYTPEERTDYIKKLSGHVISEETRRKLSAASKGRIIKLSPGTREIINEKNRNPTDETRKKLSLAGKKAWQSGAKRHRKIRRLDTKETFNNIREALLSMGIDYDKNTSASIGVYKVCLGYRKTYKGISWEYEDV